MNNLILTSGILKQKMRILMNYNKKSIFLRIRKTLLSSTYTPNIDLLLHSAAHIYKLRARQK